MIIIGIIFCAVLAAAFIGFAVVHEYKWWRRRTWRQGRGIVVGFTTERDTDGVCYFPEIEFHGQNGAVRFVSEYGSDSEPTLGESVKLFIDDRSDSAEMVTMSNRLVFTVVPLLFGIAFLGMGYVLMSSGQ